MATHVTLVNFLILWSTNLFIHYHSYDYQHNLRPAGCGVWDRSFFSSGLIAAGHLLLRVYRRSTRNNERTNKFFFNVYASASVFLGLSTFENFKVFSLSLLKHVFLLFLLFFCEFLSFLARLLSIRASAFVRFFSFFLFRSGQSRIGSAGYFVTCIFVTIQNCSGNPVALALYLQEFDRFPEMDGPCEFILEVWKYTKPKAHAVKLLVSILSDNFSRGWRFLHLHTEIRMIKFFFWETYSIILVC